MIISPYFCSDDRYPVGTTVSYLMQSHVRVVEVLLKWLALLQVIANIKVSPEGNFLVNSDVDTGISQKQRVVDLRT